MKTELDNARLDDPYHQATDIMLMEDPLEFITEDHMRDKTVAETMMRMKVDVDFAQLKTELASIHQAIQAESKDVTARLNSARSDNEALSVYDRSKIETLATRLRQDILVENTKLLPLARNRLTSDDIATLRSNMVQRRIPDMRGASDNAR
ncbi:MAG: hypothetical protein ABJF50_16095 [Paracoccaceae bacterium]